MKKEKKLWQAFLAALLSALLLAACGQSKNEKQLENKQQKENEQQTEDTQQTDTEQRSEGQDMSGDYMGTVACAEMPPDGSYTLYEKDDPYQCIVLYFI